MNLRKAEPRDIGQIAYFIVKWDEEIPEHLRQLKGDVSYAETAAEIIVKSPKFITYVLENGGSLAGAYTIYQAVGIFSSESYGILNLYVHPKERGHKLCGLRLLDHARKEAARAGLAWIESNPWKEAHGMQFVLGKLGFIDATRGFALRLR